MTKGERRGVVLLKVIHRLNNIVMIDKISSVSFWQDAHIGIDTEDDSTVRSKRKVYYFVLTCLCFISLLYDLMVKHFISKV